MKKITVDPKKCRGLDLCHECEAILPGMVMACERGGGILVSGTSYAAQAEKINLVLARCPDQAVMVHAV